MKIKVTLFYLFLFLFSANHYANESIVTVNNKVNAPSKPTGLTASNLTKSSFVLSWNSSRDRSIRSYEIYQNGKKIGVRDVYSSSSSYYYSLSYYYITGLNAGTTYTYYIRAINYRGEVSDFSDKINVTTMGGSSIDTASPTAPINLASSSQTETSINLTWGPSADNVGVASYEIFVNDKKTNTLYRSQVTIRYGEVIYTLNRLQEGTSYTIKVLAKDNAGNTSNFSAPITVSTKGSSIDTEAPTAPTNLQASTITENSIRISWEAATDNKEVVGYEIYMNNEKIGAIAGSYRVYTANNLEAGTEYTFTIKALDKAGNISDFSETLTVSTKAQEVFSVYPNPTTDVLNVQLENARYAYYAVYNSRLRPVQYGRLVNNTINVSRLREGTYTLVIYNRNKQFTKQFIKN